MPADPEATVVSEPVEGSDVPVRLMYIETRDGLYQPIGLRVPPGAGPHPVVLLASGNGGGGMARLRDFVHNRGYIMERFLEAGYASAWLRYRAEVELGYNNGGKLVEDVRQRRQLFNRSPLDYEDEISAIEHFRSDPAFGPVGLMGVSHGGEMILKIASEYGGAAAGVACEPAAHEYLDLSPDDTVFVNEKTQLRNLDGMQMPGIEKVRARINRDLALERIAGIETPILIMGREEDHLQGIFRLTYELMEEAGREVEWVSYDHPMHGYVFPVRGEGGEGEAAAAYEVNEVQRGAIEFAISFLDRYLKV